jgi:hypothetical protein
MGISFTLGLLSSQQVKIGNWLKVTDAEMSSIFNKA